MTKRKPLIPLKKGEHLVEVTVTAREELFEEQIFKINVEVEDQPITYKKYELELERIKNS